MRKIQHVFNVFLSVKHSIVSTFNIKIFRFVYSQNTIIYFGFFFKVELFYFYFYELNIVREIIFNKNKFQKIFLAFFKYLLKIFVNASCTMRIQSSSQKILTFERFYFFDIQLKYKYSKAQWKIKNNSIL